MLLVRVRETVVVYVGVPGVLVAVGCTVEEPVDVVTIVIFWVGVTVVEKVGVPGVFEPVAWIDLELLTDLVLEPVPHPVVVKVGVPGVLVAVG